MLLKVVLFFFTNWKFLSFSLQIESCALFLYKWKTSVTQIVRYTPTHTRTHTHTHTHTHAHTHTRTYAHTHTVKWKRVFPCFRFTLGSRIRLHIGSPRRASERIGRREEARGTMWERDCWRAIAYLPYVKCDQEILDRVNQRAATCKLRGRKYRIVKKKENEGRPT